MSTSTMIPTRRGAAVHRVSRMHGRKNDTATGERFRSTETQDEKTRALAARHDVERVFVFEDLDQSGGTMDRDGMNQALQLLRDGEIDTLLFASVDRFTRDTIGGLQTLREIQSLGGRVLFDDFPADTSTPEGWWMLTNSVAGAQLYRDQKGVQLKATVIAAVNEGIWIGTAPVGYLRERKRLVPDPKMRDLISTLFDRRAAGESWASLRDWWHSETGHYPGAGYLSRIVSNRVYLGEYHYGKLVSPVRHEPLVTEEQRQAALRAKAPRPARSAKPKALLAGVIKCSGCGRNMTPNATGRGKFVYKCQKEALAGVKCPAPTAVLVDRADAWVAEQLLDWGGGCTAVTTGDREADFAAVDARVAEAQTELDFFIANVSSRSAAAVVQQGIAEREATLAAAKTERDALYAQHVAAGVRFRVVDLWNDSRVTLEDRRRLVAAAVESVTVFPTPVTENGGRVRVPFGERASLIFEDGECRGVQSERPESGRGD